MNNMCHTPARSAHAASFLPQLSLSGCGRGRSEANWELEEGLEPPLLLVAHGKKIEFQKTQEKLGNIESRNKKGKV
jgi:hypothetical protein